MKSNIGELALDTVAMRMSPDDALKYVNDGLAQFGEKPVSQSTFYVHREKMKADSQDYLYEVARTFPWRHRVRHHSMEIIYDEYAKLFKNSEDPKEKRLLLKEMRDMVMYLSAFDEAAAAAMEQYTVDKKASRLSTT